ncbi:MAG: outer membrane beta-barrel protein [Verrucomicrobiales bacterium]|nr:outer membrane beta-barrel protein [Verrucomicrobiota bacterium JB025]
MKRSIQTGILGLLTLGSASAQGLYYVGTEAQESMPLKWVVGASLIYDDNVSPASGSEDDSVALNPYVGASMVSVTPQTTIDVYARLGLIYYFDAPSSLNDDTFGQSRAGVNITHRFSERLRLSSRNFISYELEPDYSYGYATSRQIGEYLYWQTDNALGFRWTERLATYTGFKLVGYDYDVANNDRFIWQLYNQFRYQLSPQTVLTLDYRYGQTIGDGASSDSTNQYLLGGVEHRFSPNTIGILRAGAQFRSVDDGDDYTSPWVEFALNSRINEQFRIRSFARYGIEDYDTVQFLPGGSLVEYDERKSLRFGLSGEYAVSRELSIQGGVDYIPTSYESGRLVSGPALASIPEGDEDIVNAYIGFSYRFTDYLTGNASYNYTNSDSDFGSRDYDRNRISVGLSAEF